MLDRSKLPHSFSVPYQWATYDFVVTNASDDNKLVLNVARAFDGNRWQFAEGLLVDRHSGVFTYSDALNADLDAMRPLAMKLNAVPAKLLGVVWRIIGGLMGMGPSRIAIGGGEVGLAWNLMVLAILVAILWVAFTIGMYVLLPLLALATICFFLDMLMFRPDAERQAKAFMEGTAGHIRDLVEDTVVY